MKKIIIAAVAVLGIAGNAIAGKCVELGDGPAGLPSVPHTFDPGLTPQAQRPLRSAHPFEGQGVSVRRSGVRSGSVVCERFEPGTKFDFKCWASEGLKDGEGATYVFLEWDVGGVTNLLSRLMSAGAIPPGIAVSFNAGRMMNPDRGMRAEEFDQPGTEFPSAILEEILPAAEKLLGVRVSRSPDRSFITGASSGGIAAWNACWFRNDRFRRAYCNSPTFSNMRGGNQLMPLVRKCETRPIRAYLTCGTDEPDYFFGDSYFVAEDAVGALRFAGYEVRFDRFAHGGHGAAWGSCEQLEKVLRWLFADWMSKPVSVATNPIRVRDAVVKGESWKECSFTIPPSATEARSCDRGRVYSVSTTNRFVMSERIGADGRRDQRVRLSALELAWNATRVGGTAIAVAADDRVWVATELGVQGIVSFGLTDVVLPLPGDLPCDNVALIGTNLYAASGKRVFVRPVKVGAADPAKPVRPSSPGYDDGFWYSRDHEPAGAIGELLGSYVVAGRIAGAVSVLADGAYSETYDRAGWANFGGRGGGKVKNDTIFALSSMSNAFVAAALLCAIDEGKMTLKDVPDTTGAAVKRLESAVGESFADYLGRKVLSPLGMTDTTFNPNDEQLKRLAKSYTCNDESIREEKVVRGPGTLYSTPRDAIRLAEMLAHRGEWQGKSVVSRKTFDAVFPAITAPVLRYADMRVYPASGRARVFLVQTENAAGSALVQLKRDWHAAADRIQGGADF